MMIDIDFAGLRSENPDVVGWIYFENEDISYPVMYSGDNSYYLRKTFKDDKVVTLSTCSTSGETYRFVVHGVRVDEH